MKLKKKIDYNFYNGESTVYKTISEHIGFINKYKPHKQHYRAKEIFEYIILCIVLHMYSFDIIIGIDYCANMS